MLAFLFSVLIAALQVGGSFVVTYPPAMKLLATKIPVLVPERLPSVLAKTSPQLESALPKEYTVAWTLHGRCLQPSCNEFAVIGGAEPDASPGTVSVRLDATTVAKYSAFRCPLHCQPETLTFTRAGYRYELQSKAALGIATMTAIYRSLRAL